MEPPYESQETLGADFEKFTMRWEDFRWNCKLFQQDVHTVKDHASGIPIIFYMKS